MVEFVIVMMRSHASCDILVVPIGLDGGTRFYIGVVGGGAVWCLIRAFMLLGPFPWGI